MRSIIAGLITALLAAVAGAVAVAAPAQAGIDSPVRRAQPSAHDLNPHKSATVSCPTDTHVFAAGFRIVEADGGVVPTGMVPDPTLSSVTVTASARTGYHRAWSLVAYAVCRGTGDPPIRIPAHAYGTSTVTATCPGETRLTGTGFRLQADVDRSYLDAVSIGPGLRQVRVHAAGAGTPAGITAFAICRRPTPPRASDAPVRVAATSPTDDRWPKSVSVGDPTFQRWLHGIGGVVEGGDAEVFLSALVPDLEANLARVQAVRARPLPAGGFAIADLGTEDEDPPEGSVTSEGILIGTFH